MLKGRVLPSIFEWSHTTKCALDLNVFCKTDRVDDILEAVASSASFQIFTNGLTRLAMMMMMIVMVMLMRVMIMMMMMMMLMTIMVILQPHRTSHDDGEAGVGVYLTVTKN